MSCLPPDAVQHYLYARDAEAAYVGVRGRILNASRVAVPKPTKDVSVRSARETRVQFRGTYLTKQGYVQPFDRKILLRLECNGPWCPGRPSGAPILTYLEQTARGFVLRINACGGWVSPDKGDAAARVETCNKGGPCKIDTGR